MDGVWNEQGMSLTLIMPAPWWMKWWCRVAMILLVIGSIGLVFYVRMRGARRREILLRETVRSRTVDLLEANEELKVKSEQIVSQNQELELHRQNLEQLVQHRTHDLELAKERAERFTEVGILSQYESRNTHSAQCHSRLLESVGC